MDITGNDTILNPVVNTITQLHTEFIHIATPPNPDTGKNKVYTKSDDNLYILNSAGVESQVGGGGGGGDVVGPVSATDNAITRYDGTTGKLIQDSLITIDDLGNILLPVGGALTGDYGDVVDNTKHQTTSSTATTFQNYLFIENSTATPTLFMRDMDPTGTANGGTAGSIDIRGRTDTNGLAYSSTIKSIAAETLTTAAAGCDLAFSTKSIGDPSTQTPTVRFTIKADDTNELRGGLYPTLNNQDDLGTATNQFKDLYLSGNLKYEASLAELWVKNNVNQVSINTVNTWTPITVNGAIIGRVSSDMTVNNANNALTIQYTGASSKTFRLAFVWVAEFVSTSTPQETDWGCFKNGSLMSKTETIQMLDDAASYPRNASINTLHTLNQNDTLQVRVKTTSTSDDILIHAFNFSIVEVSI